jgi:hypothetical protein
MYWLVLLVKVAHEASLFQPQRAFEQQDQIAPMASIRPTRPERLE